MEKRVNIPGLAKDNYMGMGWDRLDLFPLSQDARTSTLTDWGGRETMIEGERGEGGAERGREERGSAGKRMEWIPHRASRHNKSFLYFRHSGSTAAIL